LVGVRDRPVAVRKSHVSVRNRLDAWRPCLGSVRNGQINARKLFVGVRDRPVDVRKAFVNIRD